MTQPTSESEADRAALIAAYDHELEQLLNLISRITPDTWARPSPCPGWSARDLVAHLTTSAKNVSIYVDWMLEGRPNAGKAALDARNEAGVAERRHKSLPELLAELKEYHQGNINFYLSLPEDKLAVTGALASGEIIRVEDRFGRAGKHYREHGRMLAQVAGLGEDY